MKKIMTVLLVFAFISSTTMVAGANVKYTNEKLDWGTAGLSPITIDGEMGDWADIDPVTVDLKPARVSNEANASFVADFYSTHDNSKIYFLVVVKDDPYYFYNYDTGINHRYAPALGLAFPIDEGAKVQYMGGSGRETDADIELETGEVDIMHWELDTLAGDIAGRTKNTTAPAPFGDGIGNLDDEYAITSEDRNDDNDPDSENSYLGSWGHTGGYTANGTAGDWIFEISRDLDTEDPHDAIFAEDETFDVAIAFWTPNEHTNKKWTDDGHYVNYDQVIEMTLKGAKKADSDDSPGFGLIIGLSSIFIAAAIIKKRR
ncbi:MAG: ethylbenzene dehydrogenase-related protein [Candidatus Kariarchaeaceae archaeon]|jgi:hypothetical protein